MIRQRTSKISIHSIGLFERGNHTAQGYDDDTVRRETSQFSDSHLV
jgi:hypothetical protein